MWIIPAPQYIHVRPVPCQVQCSRAVKEETLVIASQQDQVSHSLYRTSNLLSKHNQQLITLHVLNCDKYYTVCPQKVW